MFTYEEAIELIREKKVLNSHVNLSPLQTKWKVELMSNIDQNNKFFLDMYISSKGSKIVLSANSRTLKTSHNHRIDKIPILRLDYGGTHKNPERASNRIPDWIAQFAGRTFNRDEPHVHIYVESQGLPDLRWAVPIDGFILDGKSFSLQFISSFKDFLLATREFADIINILNFSENVIVSETLF